jgi:hypothetical protein
MGERSRSSTDKEAKQGSNPKEGERVNAEAESDRSSSSEGVIDKKKNLQARSKSIKERDQIYFTAGVLFILFTEYILLCQVFMPSRA